jgi:hypothetical protein
MIPSDLRGTWAGKPTGGTPAEGRYVSAVTFTEHGVLIELVDRRRESGLLLERRCTAELQALLEVTEKVA